MKNPMLKDDAAPTATAVRRLRRPVVIIVSLMLLGWVLNSQGRTFSDTDDLVLQAYLAYYGRPADPPGLDYWSGRLEASGGSLEAIIDAFGDSQEFQTRYGNLPNETLIDGLYEQLLGRSPDPAGRTFYLGQLTSGASTLQRIALDVILGTTGADVATVEYRVDVARHYVSQLDEHSGELPRVPAETLKDLVTSVTADPATHASALDDVNRLIASLPIYQRSFSVTKTDDTEDGACDDDCSLREAIVAANNSPGLDWVRLPAGTYEVTLGQFIVTDAVHVQGESPDLTVLDGETRLRLIEVPASASDILISDLTLMRGQHTESGGAILNQGGLVLEGITIRDSRAGRGGALATQAGSQTTLRNCLLTKNVATNGGGGALFNDQGIMIVDGGTLSANTALGEGADILSTGAFSVVNNLLTIRD